MSIDVIFTLSKMIPAVLRPYKEDILEILNELKFDKMKPVREAA